MNKLTEEYMKKIIDKIIYESYQAGYQTPLIDRAILNEDNYTKDVYIDIQKTAIIRRNSFKDQLFTYMKDLRIENEELNKLLDEQEDNLRECDERYSLEQNGE